MKQLITLIFAALMISCGNAQNNTPSAEGALIQTINTKEAAQLIEQISDLQIIDVRTDAECAEGMIEGAIQIDINSPDFEQKINALDKEGKYLVYCRSGGRSARAQGVMQGKGFKTVYNLAGGYMGWPKQ